MDRTTQGSLSQIGQRLTSALSAEWTAPSPRWSLGLSVLRVGWYLLFAKLVVVSLDIECDPVPSAMAMSPTYSPEDTDVPAVLVESCSWPSGVCNTSKIPAPFAGQDIARNYLAKLR